MNCTFEKGSVEHQKDLFTRLGYDISNWNPEDDHEVRKFFNIALNGQLRGIDVHGNGLSDGDFELLSAITRHRS